MTRRGLKTIHHKVKKVPWDVLMAVSKRGRLWSWI